MRRLLLFLLVLALLAALSGCSAGAGDPVLELVSGDQSISLTLRDIQKMPAVEGYAGIMTSTGRMVGPFPVKGVLLSTLLDELGGVTPDRSVVIGASDGYAMTMSGNQILNGEFITYDPGTGDEIDPLAPIQVILAYEMDGELLDAEQDGNLRLMGVSDSDLQVIDGHWSVKWVEKVTLQDAIAEWVVDFEGAISEPMDRATFESGAQENCHYESWTDDEGREWVGIPLYYLLGRVDDEIKHGDDAYRDDLARAGYTIDVIAADGYSVTLDSSLVTRNDNIIAAYLVDGQTLDETDFPLRLVGSELEKGQMVGAIARVVINFPEGAVEKPAEGSGTAAAAEPAVIGPAGATLLVTGCENTEVTLSMEELMAMDVVNTSVEHPKKGAMDVTGVPLADVLVLVTMCDGDDGIAFVASDGYKVEIPVADLMACEGCLVGWDEEMLTTYMPGFEGSFWAKDLVTIAAE